MCLTPPIWISYLLTISYKPIAFAAHKVVNMRRKTLSVKTRIFTNYGVTVTHYSHILQFGGVGPVAKFLSSAHVPRRIPLNSDPFSTVTG